MIYIQLSLPYRNYDKVYIKSFYLYENSISVVYNVKNSNVTLFEKTFNILSESIDFLKILSTMPNINFSIVDNIHKLILEYMIEKNIETGTLEVR